jgi:hypothetical protein
MTVPEGHRSCTHSTRSGGPHIAFDLDSLAGTDLSKLRLAVFLVVAGCALLAMAVLVIFVRRRRRQAVRSVLEPLSQI